MAEGKSLKFQFVLDEQSFARVKRALGELTTDAAKFAKTMQSAGGGMFGGANVGRPPSAVGTQGRGGGQGQRTGIGAAILGDVDAFQKLAKSGKSGMDAMTNAVRTGVRDQMREIEKLDAKMARLQERYAKDPRAAYEGAFRTNLESQMMARRGQRTAATERMNSLMAAEAELEPDRKIPKGGIAGTGMSAAQFSAAAAVGVGLAYKTFQVSGGVTGMMSQNAADRGVSTSSMLQRTRTADISDQLKLTYMKTMGDSERAKLFARVTGGDAKSADLMESMWAAAKGDIKALSSKAGDTRTLERMKGAIELAGQDARFSEEVGRGYEYGEATHAQRMSSSRIRGAGYYYDAKNKIWIDKFSGTSANLARQGYDDSMYDSAIVQSRGFAGTGREAYAVMAANAAGYGGYGDMYGAAKRSGRVDSAGLALGGKINTTAGIQLGSGVLGSGFDIRGTTGGAGILNAAQGPGFNFTGGAGDFNQVQQIIAAQQLGSSITTGGMDTYQAGRNIIGAIGINPGGTTYAQDYLGTGMSLKQMMDAAGGDITKTAKALGLTPEMMKSQLSGSMGSVMDRFVDQGGSDPMSKAVRGFRDSGTTIDSYLNRLYKTGKRDEAESLGAYYGMMTGEGEEAGLGLVGLLGGVGTTGSKKRGPAGSIDDAAKAKQDAIATQIEQAGELFRKHLDAMKEAFGNNENFGQLLTGFAKLQGSAEKVVTAFEDLAGITPEVKKKIERTGVAGTVKGVLDDISAGKAQPKGSFQPNSKPR